MGRDIGRCVFAIVLDVALTADTRILIVHTHMTNTRADLHSFGRCYHMLT